MEIKEISKYLSNEGDNTLVLKDKNFINEKFSDFTLPVGQEEAEVLDVILDGCSVTNGSCFILGGTTLKNVTFKDFTCGDALHISSEVCMSDVKIIGKNKPAMVWVKSQYEDLKEDTPYNNNHITLDISNYFGEVSITGIPASSVKRNPQEHIVLSVDLLEKVDWKGLGFSPLSYWKLMAKKVLSAKAKDGVFSLPPKSGKNYERSMSELDILKKEGFVC